MTFLSTQTFDSDNEIKVVTKKRKILDEASGMDVQADGTIKAKARIKFEYGAVTKDDVTPFASIEDAEAYLLEEGNMFWAMGCPPINHIEEDDTVLVMFLGDDPTTLPLMFADGFGLVVNNYVADAENCGKFVRIP